MISFYGIAIENTVSGTNTVFTMALNLRTDSNCYPNEKKSDKLEDISYTYSEATHGIMTYVMLLITLFLLLTACLYVLYLWTRKYKLKYLFRISFLVFISSLAALRISHLFIANEMMPIISLFFQKSFWFTASIASGVTCFTMAIVRYYCAMPFNLIQDGTESYSHLEGIAKSRRQTVQEMRNNMFRNVCRDSNQLNYPVYPNGWIPLIESRDVPLKKVVSVTALGYRFCIYRGEEGKVFVTDAFCPHMGADFSAGGRVIENCIECPFHAWQFSGETGKCTKIPYSDKIPDIAKVKVWTSCEKNNFILIWHHSENEPPTWEIPSIPEIEKGELVYRGRTEVRVHSHIQDIQENAADFSHFSRVHSQFTLFGMQSENAGADEKWLKHDWKPQWSTDENNSHIANGKVTQKLIFCGFDVPYTTVKIDIQQIGPATIHVYMNNATFRGISFLYIIPEGPLLQRTISHLYTEPRLRQSVINFMSWMGSFVIRSDNVVWSNKIFVKTPLLVKEDNAILLFRRWYSQFYSEHSPSLKDLKERTLDW